MPKARVLVVDDSVAVALLVKTTLEANDYEVALADSGEAALEQIPQIHPDLLLLDVVMPGIDGFEVCRRLRHEPGTERLPIVLLSVMGGIKEKLAGFRAGADDYLVKAQDLNDLPYRIRLVLQMRPDASQLN